MSQSQEYHLRPTHYYSALPALHPGFSIPTVPDGGNHTRDFTNSAASIEAHQQCLVVSIALAGVGLRVLTDDTFYAVVLLPSDMIGAAVLTLLSRSGKHTKKMRK
jgi:hypothetical protein